MLCLSTYGIPANKCTPRYYTECFCIIILLLYYIIIYPQHTHVHVGLVGPCSEEVLELMVEEHPQKYQEYIAVVQEREFQATLRKKTMESKRIAILVRLIWTTTCTFIVVNYRLMCIL